MFRQEAIKIQNVNKSYFFYENHWQRLMSFLGFLSKKKCKEHYALNNLNLTIYKGDRVAIVGRNGAGKTTLLKLITQCVLPTHGRIEINGRVQALMTSDVGFHPELSGIENIKFALAYNGLKKQDINEKVADIIKFVELGDFLYQPIRTYSQGMDMRLRFAVATAIKPDILIIDEVLSAGDAYFSAKSTARINKLIKDGCTLILVSHSTQQLLEYCDKAIWIEKGEKILEGGILEVVKAYEAYTRKLQIASRAPIENKDMTANPLSKFTGKNISPGGISRWHSSGKELQITDVRTCDEKGKLSNHFSPEESLIFIVDFIAGQSGNYKCYFSITLFSETGIQLCRNRSQLFDLDMVCNMPYRARLVFADLMLGNQDYFYSVGIFKNFEENSEETYYDLLSRSFTFTVKDSFSNDPSHIRHKGEWLLDGAVSSHCMQSDMCLQHIE